MIKGDNGNRVASVHTRDWTTAVLNLDAMPLATYVENLESS